MKTLPKAELHVHLEGTITPSLVKQLAASNPRPIEINARIFSHDKTSFFWENFSEFHRVFEEALQVICSSAHYSLITYLYLAQLAKQNCLYAELIVAPFHARENRLTYEQMLTGLIDGIDKARKDFGIEGRILMALMRHYGPSAAKKDIAEIVVQGHPYVVGINLVGDIKQYEVKAFEAAFSQARSHSLHASCHAGEIDGGPKEIWQAIDYLGAERISHGVTCLLDPKLVETLIERKVVLEVCPTSNVILKMYRNYAEHPLAKLKQAGLLLTLNTDDPGFFNIDLTHEYDVAHRYFNFSQQDLLATTQQAIDAAFIEQGLKENFSQKVRALNCHPEHSKG
jgi:adenosine deaminase